MQIRISKLFLTACIIVGMCIYHTASAQNKNGYAKLFDGKTLKGWKRLAGLDDFKVQNGVIVGTTVMNSPSTYLVTEKEYGDFVLELDAKIEGTLHNAGVEIRGHYDPAGHGGKGLVYGKQYEIDPTDRKWTGGIFDDGRRDWLYPLELNPRSKSAFKPGAYNHIKIECIGNETKTWINGVAAAYVVDTIDNRGFIGLQVYGITKGEKPGKKVYFKNINIKTTGITPAVFPKGIYAVNLVPNNLTKYEKQDGWKLLFDGKTGNGWRSTNSMSFPTKGWAINNGVISVVTSGEGSGGGDIITADKYKAFDLSFEFKMPPGANSGVKYFVTLAQQTTGSALGLEYQVLDDERHPDAKLGRDGDRTLASLYDLIAAKKQARFVRPIGEWNKGRVIVYPNNHVEHYLNGIKVLEYDRGSKEFKDLIAISKYKDFKDFGEAAEGYILLQYHFSAVDFRSIKIKTL